jgi:hypothetical protein
MVEKKKDKNFWLPQHILKTAQIKDCLAGKNSPRLVILVIFSQNLLVILLRISLKN